MAVACRGSMMCHCVYLRWWDCKSLNFSFLLWKTHCIATFIFLDCTLNCFGSHTANLRFRTRITSPPSFTGKHMSTKPCGVSHQARKWELFLNLYHSFTANKIMHCKRATFCTIIRQLARSEVSAMTCRKFLRWDGPSTENPQKHASRQPSNLKQIKQRSNINRNQEPSYAYRICGKVMCFRFEDQL